MKKFKTKRLSPRPPISWIEIERRSIECAHARSLPINQMINTDQSLILNVHMLVLSSVMDSFSEAIFVCFVPTHSKENGPFLLSFFVCPIVRFLKQKNLSFFQIYCSIYYFWYSSELQWFWFDFMISTFIKEKCN